MTVKQKEKEKGNVSRPLFTACGDDRRFPQTFSEKKIRQPTTAVKQNHHFGKRQGCAEHIYQTDANELKGIKKSSAAAGLCAVGKRVPTMLRFTATCTYILFVCLRFVKFSCIHKYYALRRADHCFRWSPRVILLRSKKNKTGLSPRLQQRMKVSIRILNSFLLSPWPVLPGSLALTALPQYGSTS